MIQTSVQSKWGRDSYIMMDAGEILGMVKEHNIDGSGSWYGETNFRKHVELGDEKLVASSEKMLSKIEDQVPMSQGWINVDDVVGAVPNVPAFLAGHPQCMRRRRRVAKDNSPLVIYMDLTSSGGINAGDVQNRGIVLLALARMLVEHRAVELWVGASLGGHGKSGTVAWRIDTTPLDLARASYHVAATAMSRLFGYELNKRLQGTGGGWPFGDYDLHCRAAPERLRSVMGWGELLYVPPIYMGDKMTSDPVRWVKRVLTQYTGQAEEDAA